jgi:hypothetical protein
LNWLWMSLLFLSSVSGAAEERSEIWSSLLLAQTGSHGAAFMSNPKSCNTTAISNCDLVSTRSGGTSGVCASGYTGSCSFSCFRGTWTSASNTCTSGCTLPWGGSIPSGNSVIAYSASNPAGTCASVAESRVCTGTTLSGSFTLQSCTNGCTGTPWGRVASGYSNTAYSATSVACGGSCATVSQTRTCSNGTLSGSFGNTSCSVATCGGTWVPFSSCAAGWSTPDLGACSGVGGANGAPCSAGQLGSYCRVGVGPTAPCGGIIPIKSMFRCQ